MTKPPRLPINHLPDGTEIPVRRRAPASIREQRWLLREARRLGAEALVVECMAVDPDLQAVCEGEMIRSTIGVITNARPDHAEVMGATVDDVARALEAARKFSLPQDREIIHTLPQEFIVDSQRGIRQPAGMFGARLEARVHVVGAYAFGSG